MASQIQKIGSPPIYSLEKIQTFISEQFHLQFTLNDLKNPTPSLLLSVFSAFLQDFRFNMDSFRQIMFDHSIEHLEIMEHTIPNVHLIEAIRFILHRLHIDDFSLKDIIKPDRKRTRKILSYLINFWRFYVIKETVLCQVIDECKTIMYQIQEKEKEIEMVKQEINKQSIFLAENEKEFKEVQDCLLKKQGQLESYKQRANELQKLKSDYKLKIAENENKMKEEDVELSKKRPQLTSLQEQLVHSPDRFKAELGALRSRINELKQYGAEHEARRIQLKEEYQGLESFAEAIAMLDSTFDSLTAEIAKIKTSQEEYKDWKNKFQALQSELADLEEKKLHQEKHALLSREAHKNKVVAIIEKIKKFKEECQQAKSDEALLHKKGIEIQDEIKALKAGMAELDKKMAEEEARKIALDSNMDEFCKMIQQKLTEVMKAEAQEVDEIREGINASVDTLKKMASFEDLD